MKTLLLHAPARGALLARARRDSEGEEKRIGAFVALVESEQSLIAALQRNMGAVGLTESGFLILSFLLQESEASVPSRKIAHAVGLPGRNVSEMLTRLEISGLVNRQRSAAKIGRWAISVTPLGRRMFSSALSHSLDSICEMMSVLNDGDIAALDDICSRLRSAAEASSPIS